MRSAPALTLLLAVLLLCSGLAPAVAQGCTQTGQICTGPPLSNTEGTGMGVCSCPAVISGNQCDCLVRMPAGGSQPVPTAMIWSTPDSSEGPVRQAGLLCSCPGLVFPQRALLLPKHGPCSNAATRPQASLSARAATAA